MLDPRVRKFHSAYQVTCRWTDWESMVQIAVKGMRAAELMSGRFVDASVYFNSMLTAEWDLLLHARQ